MASAALTLPVASLRLCAVVGGGTDGRIPRRRPDASTVGGQRSEATPLLRWRAQARALGVPWWRGLLWRRCHRIAFSTRTAWLPGTSSLKTPTESVLSSVVSTSRTLLFVLVAGLLPLSGVRSLPALACAPAPTQQLQEIEEQDEEVRMYSAILSRNPGDVDALKCALYAKMRHADWGGALRYARRLRDAKPSEVEWRLMVAQLHELKGDLAKAERQFRELLAEEPLLVWALHGLALCMQKKLEGPTVFEMLENALQLATSEKRVLEERNIKLLIAQMHVVMGQLDVASEKLQNLINEDPRDFRSHLCQSWSARCGLAAWSASSGRAPTTTSRTRRSTCSRVRRLCSASGPRISARSSARSSSRRSGASEGIRTLAVYR